MPVFPIQTLPEASRWALEIGAAAHARHYAGLAVAARANGRDFPAPEGYTAAIAASRRFAVAARDPSEFVAGGRSVIDREACRIAVGLGELARKEQAGL
jgi:predicted nucleic acid-binding protein